MTDLLYAYAILPAEAPVLVPLAARSLTGVIGGRVQALTVRGISAAYSPVPATFATAAPAEHDLAWLGPQAAAHDAVNAWLFAHAEALLPLAFGTVFRDTSAIARLLEAEQESLLARLAGVRGRAEWVVTVQRDSAAALAALDQRSATLRDLRAQVASAGPGRAYLLERQLEQARRRELARQDGIAVRAVFDVLDALAARGYDEPIPAGAAGTALMRVSLLVPRRAEEEWRVRIDQLASDWQPAGYTVRVTGPGPPYRFCALGEEDVRAAG